MSEDKIRGRIEAGLSRRQAVKGLAIVGAGALAAPAFIRRSMAAPRTIKLGFVSPQTGQVAAFGSADSFVLDGIKKIIGDGIMIGGQKYPVEILVRDNQSNPSRSAEGARREDSAGGSDSDRPMRLSIPLARLALCSSSQRPNAAGGSAGA